MLVSLEKQSISKPSHRVPSVTTISGNVWVTYEKSLEQRITFRQRKSWRFYYYYYHYYCIKPQDFLHLRDYLVCWFRIRSQVTNTSHITSSLHLLHLNLVTVLSPTECTPATNEELCEASFNCLEATSSSRKTTLGEEWPCVHWKSNESALCANSVYISPEQTSNMNSESFSCKSSQSFTEKDSW